LGTAALLGPDIPDDADDFEPNDDDEDEEDDDDDEEEGQGSAKKQRTD
jgi:hypothetical protein